MLKNSNKKQILDDNVYISKRRNARLKDLFVTQRRITFVLGCILGFAGVVAIFLMSSYSRVYTVAVDGNVYLKDSYIRELTGVSDDDLIFTAVPAFIEGRLEKDPFIENAKVRIVRGRVVTVSVEEKKQIGYQIDPEGVKICFADGSKTTVSGDLLHLITNVPVIEDYLDDEQLSYVVRAFKDVDRTVIDQISEIHRYPFSYDENMMEVIMRDGNYVFVSWTGAGLLKDYYYMISGVSSGERVCLYLDDMTNAGYTSACPWEKSEEPVIAEGEELPVDEEG